MSNHISLATAERANSLLHKAIRLAYRVHTTLGPGLLESAYEAALSFELVRHDIPLRRQVPVPIRYENHNLGTGYRADLLLGDLVLVELKCQERLNQVDFKQLTTYLKLGGFPLGCVLNFSVVSLKDGIHRRINPTLWPEALPYRD